MGVGVGDKTRRRRRRGGDMMELGVGVGAPLFFSSSSVSRAPLFFPRSPAPLARVQGGGGGGGSGAQESPCERGVALEMRPEDVRG